VGWEWEWQVYESCDAGKGGEAGRGGARRGEECEECGCGICELLHALRSGSEWTQLTRRGDIAGALNTILTEPPYGDGVDEAKVSYRTV
jgi:hypothetical protein